MSKSKSRSKSPNKSKSEGKSKSLSPSKGLKSASKSLPNKKSASQERKSSGDQNVEYLSNSLKGYKLSGLSVTFTCGKAWRTLFFDKEVSKGVVRCNIQINFDTGDPPNFALGAAQKSAINEVKSNFLGLFPRTCGLHCFGCRGHCDGVGVWCGGPPPCEVGAVPNPANVGIEIDTSKKTISWFNGNEIHGCVLHKIPTGLYIGVSGFGNCVYKFISFQTLKTASKSRGSVRSLDWK